MDRAPKSTGVAVRLSQSFAQGDIQLGWASVIEGQEVEEVTFGPYRTSVPELAVLT